MEDPHLASFEVRGFKKFTDLKVENIGQFNLIVGDNNVGKTTFLEALLIDRDPKKFLEPLATIMFHIKKFNNLSDHFFIQFVSNSISQYPKLISFKLVSNNAKYEIIKYYQINKDKFSYKSALNRPLPDDEDHDEDDYGLPIDFRNIIVEDNQQFNFNIPYIPFGSLYSHELTKQYSDYVQLYVDKKEKLIESLSHMINGIKNIEVNASCSYQPILLISEKGKNKLSPLATYGDGTVKLFRILLSLYSHNRLMIDEVESGIHYSRLKDFLKSLILVAKEQKKQIFATTHSKECIEYFTQALKEVGCEEDGRIIRLAETKNGIKSYTNIYEQFENALIADSEIR